VDTITLFVSNKKQPFKWLEEDPIYFENIEAKGSAELQRKKTLIKVIRDTEKEKGTITFLYSTIKSIRELPV